MDTERISKWMKNGFRVIRFAEQKDHRITRGGSFRQRISSLFCFYDDRIEET